ncbi:MAG TPA: sulfite exporter TauE/SafE family protein [Rhabdochlamydiaceae bacterium]|nr:sulfite exporter TauE/SafE family protein [Rhabdochlamydiaceae bacterium]
MFAIELISYAVVGILAGIASGLIGISGGVITVPCLVLIFSKMGFPKEYLMHLSIGTSMAAMVFNAISSAWAHNRRKCVKWDVFWHMAPGIVIGSIIGALIAEVLAGGILEIIFAIFLLCLAIYFFLPHTEHHGEEKLPSTPIQSALGAGIGALSNILGIGGGILTVPLLMTYRVQSKKAIGTSAATGAIVTFVGALAYLFFGWGKTHFIDTVGFVYWPAFIVIGVISFFSAPFGAKLAHILPTQTIRRIFAFALLGTGISMLIR